MKKQIIALGGGGFSMEPENLILDEYILAQSAKPRPRVCLIPTASGDSRKMLELFVTCFRQLPCELSWLTLFGTEETDLRSFLLAQDVIYVPGGHTRNMLVIWREWGLDVLLREAYEAGVILAGVSAGAACWFEEAQTDSVPGRLSRDQCLGYLPGSFCAHFENTGRRPAFVEKLRSGEMKAGFGVDNFAGLHLVDSKLHQAISNDPSATATFFYKEGDAVYEQQLALQQLS